MKGSAYSSTLSGPSMASSKCSFRLEFYNTCDSFSTRHKGFLAAVQTEVEPLSFQRPLNIINSMLPRSKRFMLWKWMAVGLSLPYLPTKRDLAVNGCTCINLHFDCTVEQFKARLLFLATLRLKDRISIKLLPPLTTCYCIDSSSHCCC